MDKVIIVPEEDGRVHDEWPASVVALAGAWRDFPSAEEIRESQGTDSERVSL